MSAKKSTVTKKAATAAKASSVSEFKKRKNGVPVPLPSGLTMVMKRSDLRKFLEEGEVPNPLLGVIEEALNAGRDMDVQQMVGQNVNLDMVKDMYSMVEKVVLTVCISPKVYEVPEDEDDRDDDLLYVDEIDDEDKMFIFQWSIGGTTDLEQFRAEATASLVGLVEEQGAGSPA